MGGRGARGNTNEFAVIKNGIITQYRKIKPTDNLRDSSDGLMYRELGEKGWKYTRQTRNDLKKGNILHSLKSKVVNPQNYINSNQRWKNNELKARLKSKRSGNQPQKKIQDSKVIGYKNGRRTIDSSYKKTQKESALTAKRYELQDARIRSSVLGQPTKSELRNIQRIERGIKKLERELRR